jgi:polyisoprenoid-binding protein YceI
MTAPTAAPSTTTWKLDATHSSIEFSAKHLMITTVKGRFSELEGTVTANEGSLASSHVEVSINAASIDTRTEQRDQHLRSADFLEVEKFPKITFKSTKVAGTKEKFTLTGDLTIRGTTKPISLDVTFEGQGKDPWGGQRMGFSATGKIDRREFGLVWNQALETGGVVVSNEIKLHIDAQFVQG